MRRRWRSRRSIDVQTGTIGGSGPAARCDGAKFYEVSSNRADSHMVSNNLFAVASKYWHDLSDEQRQPSPPPRSKARQSMMPASSRRKRMQWRSGQG
jgi:hypothetical protein